MAQKLIHRSGHERLAIVRPQTGAQPLYSSDGRYVLIVNGEIYNFEELCKRHGFDSAALKSDCDVVVQLFERLDGDIRRVVDELLGVFALCIVDTQRRRVHTARDRVGISPLFGGYGDDVVVFSSELKGVVCDDRVKRVEQFPPGHTLVLDFGDGVAALCRQLLDARQVASSGLQHTLFAYQRYWSPREPTRDAALVASAREADYATHARRVHDTLVEAVHTRLRVCDVPFGVLLSGGLDSSLVASIAAKYVREHGTAWQSVRDSHAAIHTFAVGLKDSPDLAAAARVAAHIGSIHHELIFSFEQGLVALDDVIEQLETYDSTTIRSSVPMSLLIRLIAAFGIKVVLSGEGADELAAGYMYFHMAPTPEALQAETELKVEQLYHYDVLRANKIGAMYGTEVRVPFLDQRVVQLLLHETPAEYKMPRVGGPKQKRIEKCLLRDAFDNGEYLPNDVLWRQKEQFSDGVGTTWIGGLKAHAEKIVSDARFAERTMRYPFQTPHDKESMMFRDIFEECYAGSAVSTGSPSCAAVFTQASVACSTATALEWCALGNDVDPSGRSVKAMWADD